MSRLKNLLRLAKDERGNVLVMGAAMMPLMIGSAALALDSIQISLWKRQLQRSADSAAISGAHSVLQNRSISEAVQRDLSLNNDLPLLADPVIEQGPSGTWAGNPRAVRVTLATRRTLPFMAFFNSEPTTITVSATAASVFHGQYCMVALESGTGTGVTFAGNSSAELGCGVATNSRSATAITAAGSARVVATPVAAVGGIPSSTGYVQPTTLLPYSPQQTDPFASLPLPAPENCGPGIHLQPNTSMSVSAGCYKGMSVKGTLNLGPGTYFIDGSVFALDATARLSGENVTIVLTSSTPTNPLSFATIDIHGNAQANLTSSTSGPYQNILFYGDPRAPATMMTITGNSSSSYRGGFYFRNQDLNFIGNTGMQTECMQFVARRISLSGNSKISNSCPSGGPRSFDATFVRLVG